MLKYIEIIRNLTLDEKIKALFNLEFDGNKHIATYELPIFSLKKDNSFENFEYPLYSNLAQTWDKELLNKLFACYGARIANLKSNMIVAASADTNSPYTFSSDPYLNGDLTASFINGLNSAHVPCGIIDLKGLSSEIEKDRNNNLLYVEKLLDKAEPFMIHQIDSSVTAILCREFNYKGFLLFNASNDIEAVKGFFNKNYLAFNSIENAEEVMKKAISAYKNALLDVNQGYISQGQFEDLERTGQIFNPELLDSLIDNQLDYLAKFDYLTRHENPECKYSSGDEDNMLNQAGKEMIVMLKNDNVLPVKKDEYIAVIGDLAYMGKDFKKTEYTPLKEAKNHQLHFVGACHGYVFDSETTEDFLAKEAIELADKANISLVYIGTKDVNDEVLPDVEINVLKAIKESGHRVVAVVNAGTKLDYSFEEYCDAILYVGFCNEKTYPGVFEILEGKYSPSGKLAFDIYKTYEDNKVIYKKVGAGLSFATIEYKMLEVKGNQVSFVMHNKSNYIAHEIPLLYIQKYASEAEYKEPTLRGYTRVDLYPNEASKIIIPFDKFTFRSYSKDKDSYGISEGTYAVSIYSSSDKVELTQGIDLKENYEKNIVTNKLESKIEDLYKGLNDFAGIDEKLEDYKKSLKTNLRKNNSSLFVSVMSFGIILGIFNLLTYSTSLYALIQSGIVVGICLIITIVGFSINRKKYNKQMAKVQEAYDESSSSSKYLNMIMDSTSSFEEKDKVTYALPTEEAAKAHADELEEVKVSPKEEVVVEEVSDDTPERIQGVPVQQVSVEEEVVEATVDDLKNASSDSFKMDDSMNEAFVANTQALKELAGKSIKDTTNFSKKSLVQEIVLTFSNFMQSRGLMLDPRTTRGFISLLFSNKLIFVKSDDAELYKKFVSILNEFLGNEEYVLHCDEHLKSFKNLIWNENANGRCTPSEFTNYLFKIKNLENHLNVCFIDNCDVLNIAKFFSPFLSFCKAPMLGKTINLGSISEPLYYTIPENLVFIVNPSKEEYLEEMPHGVAEISSSISISPKLNEVTMDKLEYCLSYPVIKSMMHDAKEANYLTEEFWKKIDDFEEGMVQFDDKFRIENKSTLMIEAFASVIMENGADNMEIAEDVFMYHLIPLLKSSKLYYANRGDEEIANLIKKIYAGELAGAIRLIKKPMQVTE